MFIDFMFGVNCVLCLLLGFVLSSQIKIKKKIPDERNKSEVGNLRLRTYCQ